MDADFEVCTPIPAAQSADATVNSLLFRDGSALNITNTVINTSGAVESVPDGVSSINGGSLTSPNGLAFNTPGAAAQTVTSSITGSGPAFSVNKVGTGTVT